MTNDYILFDQELCDRFVAYVARHGLAAEVRPDAIEGFAIAVSEPNDDAVVEAIDAFYDELMAKQVSRVEADDPGSRSSVAIEVTLPNGESRVVTLSGQVGRRLFEQFSCLIAFEVDRNKRDVDIDGKPRQLLDE